MVSLKLLLTLAAATLASASNIYWTVKFWRYDGPACVEENLIAKKPDKLEARADIHGRCKSWEHTKSFSAFRYQYHRSTEFNIAPQESYGDCDIFVWSEKNCKGDIVYEQTDANRDYKLCPKKNTCMEPGCNKCPTGACGMNFTQPGQSVSLKCVNYG